MMPVLISPFFGYYILIQFGQREEVNNGLTLQQMRRIQLADRSTIQIGEICPVCMEDFSEEGNLVLRRIICGHTFHERCIFTWLANQSNCPVCRHQITNDGKFKKLHQTF